jgi:5'-nucleotidase (lipoprotein e(P4) family)
MIKKYILLIFIAALTACNCFQEETKETRNISEHSQTMATLYNYYADEYKALAYQAFNIAHERVDKIRRDNPYNENLAIVVDIDETLLDNSPHQALMIQSDSNYPYMWNEWCDLANANAIPGALAFLQYADENGFNVFYVSNRKEKYVQKGTMQNLISLGFPQVTEDHFLLRLERTDSNPNPSDKQGRRDDITARGYKIVLLIGDNLGDFYTDKHERNARAEQLESFKTAFGHKFIILPNAMYGNWPGSIGIKGAESMDSLLFEMTKAFE